MDLNKIDFSTIEKATLTVLYPFTYSKQKVLQQDEASLVKFPAEYLKDFLPYTRNFFGQYHFSEESSSVSLPCVLRNNDVSAIEFVKDKRIKEAVAIKNFQLFFFEKSIAILSIEYGIPENLTDEKYLYYHHKLSMLEKRSKQNIKTSEDKEFKYYFEFIDDLISPYCDKNQNIFGRSNLHTYNLLQATAATEDTDTKSFLEPLTQYRAKLDIFSQHEINANHIQQTANINTIANENVVVHIGIQKDENDFIANEFFKKYQNNHFLTYIITLYQVSKLEQLIIKAFLKEVEAHDLKNMRSIKREILHFISNGNFTKISNNSIRNNLYKFYRNSFEVENFIDEIDTIAEKITNEIETKQARARERRELFLNVMIGLIGIGLGIAGLL